MSHGTTTYDVVALHVPIAYNAFGDYDRNGALYALAEDAEQLRSIATSWPDPFPNYLEEPERVPRPHPLARPLVLRVRCGERLRVRLTNERHRQLGRRPGDWDDRRIVWVEGGWAGGHWCAVIQGFPVEIISHCVWLYYRFPLSFRDVEEMMLQRGIVVSHETIRQWSRKFGQTYANALRRRRARPGDTWHLDEVFLTINGQRQYLWRAVDQDGNVLDILVTSRRDAKAATRFFRKLLTGLEYVPRVLVTDKLASYGVAH
ncbi:MAG: IS6 family transposase, partial [Pseudonocardiaceae bacterium]